MSSNFIKIILIFISINFHQSLIAISIKGNNPSELNFNLSTENFLLSFVYNNYYTIMGIGNPNQNIVVRVIPTQKDFLFNEKNCKVFYEDNFINKKKLSRNNITMKYNITQIGYRKNLSKSFMKNDDIILGENYDINFFSAKERMVLDDYRNILTKDEFNESEIIYPYSQSNLIKFSFVYEETLSNGEICGSIGLASYNDKNNNKFIEQLKTSNITQNYYWTIKYFSYDTGFIIFGGLPHEYSNPKKNSNNSTSSILLETYSDFSLGSNYWAIKFDEIYFNPNEKNKKEKININTELRAIFSFSKQIIIAPSNYQSLIIINFFQEFFDKNICTQENLFEISYSIIKCRKNPFEKSVQKFPSLFFNNKELKTIFNLTYKDLFMTFNQDIYFLIIFRIELDKNNDVWELGVPFLKKYQMIFNSDTKKIGYYVTMNISNTEQNKKINKNNEINNNFSFRTFIEIFIVIIFIAVLIFLAKKLYLNKIKQKRPYELQDEDYDYFSNNNKIKKNDDINYSREEKLSTTQIIEMEKH